MHVRVGMVGGLGFILCGLTNADGSHRIDSAPILGSQSARYAGMASKSLIEMVRQEIAILVATSSWSEQFPRDAVLVRQVANQEGVTSIHPASIQSQPSGRAASYKSGRLVGCRLSVSVVSHARRSIMCYSDSALRAESSCSLLLTGKRKLYKNTE